jgi:apolipoprotein N-acyltransferase
MLDRLRPLALGAAALALSAACFYFGTGLRPVWWLTWLAPLPALLFAYRARARAAGLVASGAWLAGGLNVWTHLRDRLGVPFPVVAAVLLLPATVFMLAVLLSGALLRRGFVAVAVLALPATWVAFEYLLSVGTPNGTAFNLAYSQMDCLPLVQVASLTGLWGVSFAVLLLPSAVAVSLSARGPRAARLAPAVAAVAAVALALSYGAWRMQRSPDADSVTVGLAATDVKALLFPETRPLQLDALRQYAEQVDGLARRGAEVIIFPEKLSADPLPEEDFATAVGMFRAAAERSRVTLVVGLARKGEPLDDNLALIFCPDGSGGTVREETYSKHHLVPGFEDHMRSGTGRVVLRQFSAPCGVEICKDLDFPPLSRAYSADGVGLLLVPAWDFEADRWLHCRMAVMRGVEGGFSIARAAKQGLLTVSDSRGRVLAEERTDAAPFATLTARIPVAHEGTPYARYGDWLPWICFPVAAGSGICLLYRPRRPGQEGARPALAAVAGLSRNTSAP